MKKKIIGVLKHDIFKNTTIYYLGNILPILISFISVPILTRCLIPHEYGLLGLFQTIITLSVLLIGWNIYGLISAEFFKLEKFMIAEHIGNMFIVFTIIFSFLFLFIYIFKDFLVIRFNMDAYLLFWGCFAGYLRLIFETCQTIWMLEKKSIRFIFFKIIETLLIVILSIYFVVYIHLQGKGRIYATLFVICLITILNFILVFREGYIKFKFDKHIVIKLFKFGVPLSGHSIGMWILGNMCVIFLNKYGDPDAIGLYSVSLQLTPIINFFGDAFCNAWMPFFYKKMTDLNNKDSVKIVKVTYLYFFILLLIPFLINFIAPFFYKIVAGKAFNSASKYVLGFCLGFSFLQMYFFVSTYIFYSKKTYVLGFSTAIVGVLAMIIYWFLIKNFGLLGASIAFPIGYFLLFLFTFYQVNRFYKMPWLYFLKII